MARRLLVVNGRFEGVNGIKFVHEWKNALAEPKYPGTLLQGSWALKTAGETFINLIQERRLLAVGVLATAVRNP